MLAVVYKFPEGLGMKKIIYLLFLIASLLTQVSAKDVYVNGYYRSNGTYVRGHYRTAPDNTLMNNYSTRGNTNPYTGKKGHLDPYTTSSKSFYGSLNSSYQF